MRVVLILLVLLALVRPEWVLHYLPAFLQLALCWLFARTLIRAREPIVSMFARLERGTLTPELASYTRKLTWIWTIALLVFAVISLVLALEDFGAWAFVAGYVPVAVLFFGEHVYRRIRYPHYEHSSPWAVIRRIRESGALTGK